MLSIKLDLSKRTLLLILTLGCLFSCTEEPDPLPPAPILNISDTSGAWSWSSSIVGEPGLSIVNVKDLHVSVNFSTQFKHAAKGAGIFTMYITDASLDPNINIENFDSRSLLTPERVISGLSYDDGSTKSWHNEYPDKQWFEIFKVVEFDGHQFADGRIYSYACNTDLRPVCQTVEGTFHNVKIRYSSLD